MNPLNPLSKAGWKTIAGWKWYAARLEEKIKLLEKRYNEVLKNHVWRYPIKKGQKIRGEKS